MRKYLRSEWRWLGVLILSAPARAVTVRVPAALSQPPLAAPAALSAGAFASALSARGTLSLSPALGAAALASLPAPVAPHAAVSGVIASRRSPGLPGVAAPAAAALPQ